MSKNLSYIKRHKKSGKFLPKNLEETKDDYNKYAKKFFKNLSLPRNVAKPIPNYPYIYKWFRKDTGKIFYVGAGVKKRAWNLSRRNNLTINVIRKIGKKGVKIEIVRMKSWEDALKEEENLIKKFGRKDNKTGILTNMTDGGQGKTGSPMSDSTKKAISEANKKRVYTKEMRLNLSKKLKIIKANVSNETRKKLSEKFKGKPRPKWMREIMLDNLNRGRVKSTKYWTSDEGLKILSELRELTKKWHASEAGRKWHSKHGKETWINRKTSKKICLNCNSEYETYFPSRSKFCSNNCKSAYRTKKLS
ncbi:hypothetical protein OA248_03295 [Candidatus Pelagibacter sp.]|nr:hypothetical protein [Candidatus Pelagibacter sp.]